MPHPLPFSGPALLAPMEGITEPCYRDLVLERNPGGALGGAFTEFTPVVNHAIRTARIKRLFSGRGFDAPVGLQLIGSNEERLAATTANAVEASVPLVDMNFGCPTRGALATCAGSALLRNPQRIERIVQSMVRAAGSTPVTAKIRAGFDNDSMIEVLARAVENGGASMLTIHCRTRAEGYCKQVNWTRIARAVAAVSIPVCGNGGIDNHGDFARMRRETGCRYTMAGRAALGDPWIFSNRVVTAGDAARFLLDYRDALAQARGCGVGGAAARIKQLLHFWTAGNLLGDDRADWLRLDAELLMEKIASRLPAEQSVAAATL